ncbi:MAG: hypothetical protein WAO02_17650 [Verrucomicrobiia bacterium]
MVSNTPGWSPSETDAVPDYGRRLRMGSNKSPGCFDWDGVQRQLGLLVSLLGLAGALVRGAETDDFQQLSFTVDGVARTALVYVPPAARNVSKPLVTFIFPVGHQFNHAAPALIVKFFMGHPGARSPALAQEQGFRRQWEPPLSAMAVPVPVPVRGLIADG